MKFVGVLLLLTVSYPCRYGRVKDGGVFKGFADLTSVNEWWRWVEGPFVTQAAAGEEHVFKPSALIGRGEKRSVTRWSRRETAASLIGRGEKRSDLIGQGEKRSVLIGQARAQVRKVLR